MTAQLDALRRDTETRLAQTEAECQAQLLELDRRHRRKTAARMRWSNAIAAVLLAQQREAREFALVVASMEATTRYKDDDMRKAAKCVCLQARRLIDCDEMVIYYSMRSVLDLPGTPPTLYRLKLEGAEAETNGDDSKAPPKMLHNVAAEVVPFDSLVGKVMQHNKVFRFAVAHEESDFNAKADMLPGSDPPQEMLLAPLLDEAGEPCGVIRCTKRRGHPRFTQGDEQWLSRLVPSLSIVMRNAVASARSTTDRLMSRALVAITSTISPTKQGGERLMLCQILDIWSSQAKELICADRCTIMLFDNDARQLLSYSFEGVKKVEIDFNCDPVDQVGIAGSCALSRRGVNVRDAKSDSRFASAFDAEAEYVTRCALAMPIISASTGRLIGVCEALNKTRPAGAHFKANDELVLGSVMQVAAIVIENAQLSGEC